ncbi:MAG: MATE family efflux transporter [Fusobacteriaceae bacterium]
MEAKHKLMGTENMTKLLIQFSLPAMIGMIVNALYNIVDRMYIGRIEGTGHFDIAGVGLVMPAMIISFSIALMVGMGGSTMVSLTLGKKNKKLAEEYLGNIISLGAFFGIILSVLTFVFIKQIAVFMGTSKNTFIPAINYLQIIAIGFPFSIIGYSANASIRSDGSPKISMGTLLIGAILNIILDPIFIFVFDMGVKGAAIATIVSQFVSMIWAVGYFLSSKSGVQLHLMNLKLKLERVIDIIKMGIAPCFLQLSGALVIFTLNNTLKKVSGDYAVGAMTIVLGIAMFFVMPILGINQALLPLAGYNYGSKLYPRVKGILKRAIVAATGISVFSFLIIQLFSRYFIYAFTTNYEIVTIASKGLRIYTFMFPIIGFQIVSSIYFQAVGKPKITMFLTLSRQVIFLVPLVIILSKFYGEAGVWFSAPIADILSFTVTLFMIRREMKDLDKLEKKEFS